MVKAAQKYGSTPKDVFLHLFSILLLYTAAIHWGVLLFQLIDLSIPDILDYQYVNPAQHYYTLRWAVATLIVSFPVYIWSVWQLNRDYQKSPEKRQLKVRKWLVYFTLFATALIIIGDLIAVLYQFLDGSLSMRFGLKVITILGIAGSIFFFYQSQFKQTVKPQILQYFGWGAILAVIASVGISFVIAGSPQTQRLRRIDTERVEHLQQLQNQILTFWQQKEVLPQTLEALNDDLSGFQPPTDPQTNEPYGYHLVDDLTFKLCSQFATDFTFSQTVKNSDPWDYNNANWQHGGEPTCFERTIDPDRYRQEYPKPITQPTPANR